MEERNPRPPASLSLSFSVSFFVSLCVCVCVERRARKTNNVRRVGPGPAPFPLSRWPTHLKGRRGEVEGLQIVFDASYWPPTHPPCLPASFPSFLPPFAGKRLVHSSLFVSEMAVPPVFWAAAQRSHRITGNEMETLLRRSLEDNPFSAAGLDLRRAHNAARLLRSRKDAPSAGLPVLAYAEAELMGKEAEVGSRVADVVREMGLSYPAVAPAVLAAPPAAPIIETAVPNEQPYQGVPPPEENADAVPLAAAPTDSPSPLGTQKSALAMMVAKAKAKRLGDSSGGATAASASPPEHHRHARQPPQPSTPGAAAAAATANRASLKRPRALDEKNTATGDEEKDNQDEDDDSFAVHLPPGVGPAASANLSAAPVVAATADARAADGAAVKHPSQMTREEFLRQYKRAPRRGEVGQSAEEIAKAQQLGYVMSGSRSIGAQMYVDRIQRQLHEREASKLQQHFRKVEDERMDAQMIDSMLRVLEEKVPKRSS